MTTVNTVLGPISVEQLGATLMHEHLLSDFSFMAERSETWQSAFEGLVDETIAERLRADPFCCLDNCVLDDAGSASSEVEGFRSRGGATIVDATPANCGRNATGLQRIAQATQTNIIMGAGWYQQVAHPDHVASSTVEQLTVELVREFELGVNGEGIRPGVIGEIGISPAKTADEIKCLRAGAQAQFEVGVPLEVHLPGWERFGHEILDICEAEGVPASSVVLAHMNPSGHDYRYQSELAHRGAWLEYDMIGMDMRFPRWDWVCPTPEEDLEACSRLVESFSGSLLLSHDLFTKVQLTRHGGPGLSFISDVFLPELAKRTGRNDLATALLVDNPRRAFEAAAARSDVGTS